jgi:protein-S-isoprenylcysteine O-methyltransferase Ste14
MLQTAALIELVLCWVAWALAFVEPRKQAAGQNVSARAPASKGGIICQTIGFAFVWAYVRPVGFEMPRPVLIASMILAPVSTALAWAAARHLGKQWRFEAALVEGHELIQTGPYRWIRHPIYASMLGMFLATALARTWWPMTVAGLIAFLTGTEVRIRAEDRLLAGRFADSFPAYRSRVRAYVPFIR